MPNSKSRITDPEQALLLLKEGNQRFMGNLKVNRDFLREIEETKNGQTPFAVVVSCMDSRTSAEIVFDQGLGDIFSIRIAGNVVTPEVIASCEYACHVVGACLIIVLGHTGCGAIQGTVDNVELGHLHTIVDRIRSNVEEAGSAKVKDLLRHFTHENVKAGVTTLQENSEVLRNLIQDKKVQIKGGIYDITDGSVDFRW